MFVDQSALAGQIIEMTANTMRMKLKLTNCPNRSRIDLPGIWWKWCVLRKTSLQVSTWTQACVWKSFFASPSDWMGVRNYVTNGKSYTTFNASPCINLERTYSQHFAFRLIMPHNRIHLPTDRGVKFLLPWTITSKICITFADSQYKQFIYSNQRQRPISKKKYQLIRIPGMFDFVRPP